MWLGSILVACLSPKNDTAVDVSDAPRLYDTWSTWPSTDAPAGDDWKRCTPGVSQVIDATLWPWPGAGDLIVPLRSDATPVGTFVTTIALPHDAEAPWLLFDGQPLARGGTLQLPTGTHWWGDVGATSGTAGPFRMRLRCPMAPSQRGTPPRGFLLVGAHVGLPEGLDIVFRPFRDALGEPMLGIEPHGQNRGVALSADQLDDGRWSVNGGTVGTAVRGFVRETGSGLRLDLEALELAGCPLGPTKLHLAPTY